MPSRRPDEALGPAREALQITEGRRIKSFSGLHLAVNFGRATGFTPLSVLLVSTVGPWGVCERRVGHCKFTPRTKVGLEPEGALTAFLDSLQSWVEFFGWAGGARTKSQNLRPRSVGWLDPGSDSSAESAPTACCLCSEEKDAWV